MKLKLKALRVNAGLTQEDVSRKMHVSKTTIGSWENYESYPTADRLSELSKLYNCSIDDIFILDKLS
jgi:transcriptional regulator with XRE-family HTH domain